MATDQRDINFDDMCDVLTRACQRAAGWKQHYAGGAYSTRIVQAIIDLEAAISLVKSNPEIAELFNNRALEQLKAVQQAIRG